MRVVETAAAWVLSNARECAADPTLRVRQNLAEAIGVNKSQISRWENSSSVIDTRRLDRYEQVLQLDPGGLSCMMEFLHRNQSPMTNPRLMYAAPNGDLQTQTDALFDRLLDSTVELTDDDWRAFTATLSQLGDNYLPKPIWTTLLRRCLDDMVPSTFLSWAVRFQASAHMATHPGAIRAVLEIGEEEMSAPSATESTLDIACMLQYTSSPAATQLLAGTFATRQASAPDDIALGLLMALTTHAHTGRLTHRQAMQLSPYATELTVDETRSTRARRAAAAFLHTSVPTRAQRLAPHFGGDAANGLTTVLLQGSTLSPGARTSILRQVCDALAAEALPSEDPTFRTLLTTAVSSADTERRGNACGLLMLSPQGPVVGQTLFALVTPELIEQRPWVAAELMATSAWLPSAALLPGLVELAFRTDLPLDLATRAARIIGNTVERPGPDKDARDELIAAGIRKLWAGGVTTARRAAGPSAFAYTLGMRQRRDLLADLHASLGTFDPALREEWEPALAAWLPPATGSES